MAGVRSHSEFNKRLGNFLTNGTAPCPDCGMDMPAGDHDLRMAHYAVCGGKRVDAPVIEIDAEFKALIPPLSDDERAALEASLLSEGCRDALIVWRSGDVLTLVDGHNRYHLCHQRGIAYKVLEREFASRDDVIIWMVQNQLARRNLTDFARAELALKSKDAIAHKAKNNQLANLKQGDNPPVLANLPKRESVNTRREVSELAGVSERTLPKVENVVQHAPEVIKDKARAGEISITRADEITKALHQSSDLIRAAATQHEITDPQLIRLLEDKKNTDTVQSVLASGYLQNGDESATMPLGVATAWDLQGLLRRAEKEHRARAADQRLAERHAEIQTAPADVFSVVYADCPWRYDNSGLYGSAETIYPTLSVDDLCEYLAQINLRVQDNAVLFFWATNPLLPEALRVIQAWHFTYKTNLAWDKEAPTTGLGFFLKGQHELLLIATRGSFHPAYMPPSLLRQRKTDHSRKPAIHSLIESMYPQQRYIELFARSSEARQDWAFFGGES